MTHKNNVQKLINRSRAQQRIQRSTRRVYSMSDASGTSLSLVASPPDITCLAGMCTPAQLVLLRSATKTTDHTMRGEQYVGKVVDVYDGDTIRVVVIHNEIRAQYKVRMYGYDSPEMKPGKTTPNRQALVEAANAAKSALDDRIGGCLVYVVFGAYDKYGRVLANIYELDDELNVGANINDWMIASGHGKPYFGGTKC